MSAFTDAIERNLRGIVHIDPGPVAGCPECPDCDDPDDPSDEWYTLASEGGFAWSEGDSCGSTFGGDRYAAHGFRKGDEPTMGNVIHLDICGDCLMFHASGE